MKLFSQKTTAIVLGSALALSLVGIGFSPSFTLAAALTRQLDIEMTGSDVSDLQTFLAVDPTIYPQGLVTGYFGAMTATAVSNFQARNGLPSVGRVGPQTLLAINAQMNGGPVTGSDRYAPTIGSLILNTSTNAASFSWLTDENSSALVYYSSSPLILTESSAVSSATISGTPAIANIDLRTMHGVSLTGLQSNTRYYYVVYVKDASGNETLTWPSVFTTPQ
jgi:hypothetical protein